ncbi:MULTISPECIES: EAL domain-containing protein [unclassified Pseudoalteromonas]|uniref:EAL domain-containing protein n=1 Tax=unclassified Pseudoalteromonas TaxID=194690 RepID=UPI0025B41F03|nr:MULTISPECIES: EAL domain-containing protein [unclassified Pseudoalteromonas]MDN3378378.1 EAL domain-containing protein [Pseudoalteromonas sp. APC 3893]MDN3386298.1 EAL domain-containing protein [Pseudoalteromonas sp. APC 4017]
MGNWLRIFIFAVLASCTVITAQINAKVKRLSPSEGLSQSYVSKMLIDNNGYLWLATEGGLNRYDGYQVLHISGPNGELNEVIIDRIYQDPEGNIWIASLLAGLFRYDPVTDSYQQFLSKPISEEQILSQSVFSMVASDDKSLWIGRGWDFARLDIESGVIETIFELPERTRSTVIRDLFYHQGYIFIATSSGAYVYHVSTGQYRPLEHLSTEPEHIYQNYIKSFALGENNKLLVGAVRGLYEVDISNLPSMFERPDTPFKNTTLLPNLNIWKIINEQGVYDIGTDKGLFKYDATTGELVKNTRIQESEYALSDTSIIDIVKDKNGAMWVATKSDGAFYLPLDNYHFENLDASKITGDGLSHPSIWGITEYEERVWLATHNGLTAVDLTTLESEVFLKDYQVDLFTTEFSIYKITPYKNKLWLHTNRGVFSFDPHSYEILPAKVRDPGQQHLIDGWVHGSVLMPNGQLFYVHPEYGMFIYNIDTQMITPLVGEFEQFEPFLAYGFLPPLSTMPDSPLFYNSGVLYHVNPDTYALTKIYTLPEQHENVAVNVMSYVVDKNNVLWISLSNFGLIGLDATSYKLLHTIDLDKNKLGTLLYDMVLDESGMIWMSSHKGIWRLNPENKHFQQFTTSEGVVSTEFNSGAFTRLKTGQIVYGTLKGFTYFYPKDNSPKHGLIKHVNVTSIDIMSRELAVDLKQPIERVILEHDDIGLEVAFSAMAFNYQERIIYEYQLSGGQKSYTRNNNRVLFPKLNPGEYQLKIWAKDPLTGDVTHPATLDIEVKYPLWRSPIFMVLYVLLFLAIVTVWVMRRNRIQQILLAAHRESQESEARLKLALEGSHSGVWDWQSSSPIIYQPRLKNELDYDIDTVNLDDYLAKIHPQDKQKFRLEWLEFLSTEKGYFNCTYRLRHKAGNWRWYKDFGKVVAWQGGTPEKVAGTYTNMTRELVFEEHARLFGAAFEQTRDWVFILDKNLRILATNQSLQTAFNFAADFHSSRSLKLGMSRTARMNYLRIMRNQQVGEHYSAQDTVRLANGELRHVLIKISAVAGNDNRLESYVVILTDIHAQKMAESELFLLANYDGLTGLPNRTLFNDRVVHALEQAESHSSKVALLNINIKRFKYFNDSLGHEAADTIIKMVAKRIKSRLRINDSIARFNGDEFMLLVEDVGQIEEVVLLCAKIMNSVNEGIILTQQTVNVSLSIGVALYPDDASTSTNLVKAADVALYHAKKSAEGSYQFYKQEMNQHVQRALHLESQINKAYKEHEFCNHYQPIVNAKEQKVEGFEVLLRWPDNTVNNPQEFALVAESIGLITKIMLQTLSRALIELKQWQLITPDLYVSINLSALDFEYQGLVEEVNTALRTAGVRPDTVVFEITESVLMDDSAYALKSMTRLKQLGCRLYMDDFGTGYASFTYLKRFPIDVLKIDRSFVTDIGVDNGDEAIIESTLTLAKSLGKECVAEGVETKQQLTFLRALGCNMFQGYLFSKPIPGDDVTALLAKDWSSVLESD